LKILAAVNAASSQTDMSQQRLKENSQMSALAQSIGKLIQDTMTNVEVASATIK
jgi:hypothetical protein